MATPGTESLTIEVLLKNISIAIIIAPNLCDFLCVFHAGRVCGMMFFLAIFKT